ncbi:MAG: tRNA dihydrouridine synthase DusB [Candidatus Marinimicrobia bacterium]|nr:tRNA dihydrouridine synthase DusB [Candidatus Neomarinimicrobiota bacterium]|tara:strand:- start:65 stop:1057 length:993 start_codon:yes stop_codon:yes gene_type:complete
MKKELLIGNVKLTNPIFLAPMAGVTDHPFRVICRNMGAGVVYTEFVSSDGIIRESIKTLDMIKFKEIERPIGVQIFGNTPDVVSKAAKIVCKKFNPDILDINYGCPVPKVVNRGAGSGALKDLCLMDDITSAVIEQVPRNIPVTVKMRIGYDSSKIVSTEAAIRLEKLGVSAITLHPRTTKQAFKGKANWLYIKEMKEAVSIPIIGNGDISNADDAIRMFEETECDAVMVARGCLGNPWIFKQIQNRINGINQTDITTQDRLNICKYHLELLRKNKNPQLALNLTKKHFSWYIKGFSNAVNWRTKFLRSKSHEEVDLIMMDFEKFISEEK